MRNLLFITLMLSSLVGCTTYSRFSAISAKNINTTDLQVEGHMLKGIGRGEHCQHIIFFIPTSAEATLDQALDNALESQSSNLLLNANVKHNWFYIFPIYGQNCWKIDGVAYDTNK